MDQVLAESLQINHCAHAANAANAAILGYRHTFRSPLVAWFLG
jgi:hypothetical protein